MPRSYHHIQKREKEILELREQGKVQREICKKYRFKSVKNNKGEGFSDFPCLLFHIQLYSLFKFCYCSIVQYIEFVWCDFIEQF